MKNIFVTITIIVFLLITGLSVQVIANPQTAADTGQIINVARFAMPQLNRYRTLRIYLPKEYNTSAKRYPVIYMLDGQNLYKSDAAIKSTWAIDSTLNAMPLNQQCIVVGIDHAGKDRITEYDPYDSRFGKGDGMAFSRFLAETLKPYIDSHYRTKKQARYTAIAGSSMGSLLAMYAIVQYPDSFGNAGIFSPAFWIAPDIFKFTQATPITKRAGFYITCGDKEGKEMLDPAYKMDSVLMAKGLARKQAPAVKVNQGFSHNELQWRTAFPAFFNWLVTRF